MKFCRSVVATCFLLVLTTSACTTPQDDPGGGGQDEGGKAAGGKRGGTGGTAAGAGGSAAGGAGEGGAGEGVDAGTDTAPGGTGGTGPAAGDCVASMPKSLFCDPLQKMPMTIKETGLFPSAPDFTKHAASMRKFTPFPPLWSDGMEKERFLLLPAGKKIDNTDPKSWVFPVGTILVKTFFDDSGAAGAPRPIETRFIRRVGEATAFTEYDYYLYQWNPDGKDAKLILDDRNGDSMAFATVKITINRTMNGTPLKINNGQPFDHTLPSRDMCGGCHQQNGVTFQTFIGFDELRLNTKVTPTAVKTQLQEFLDAAIFMKPGAPAPATIVDADPTLLKVKQFIKGNCVHCHNAKGMVFDMSPEVFVANTVGQATMAQSVQPPPGWLRIVPGDPEKSVLYVQARRMPLPMPTMAGADRLRPMPPYGVNDIAPDQDGLAAIKAWILSLKK
jgi:hypothetical protein